MIAFIGLLLWSCGADQNKSGKSLEEYPDVSNNASIIRNPVSADGLQDTTNVAKLEFEEEMI
jgi:hypothetical protein